MGIRSYKDLLVWQKGMELVRQAYLLGSRLPKEEAFGLTSQIRRAAVSVPLNIAEGYGRNTTKSYRGFLRNARSSTQEVETAVQIAIMLGYLTEKDCAEVLKIVDEESRMLNSLINKLKEDIK